MRDQIQRLMLRSLLRMGNTPMGEEALFDTCRVVYQPRPTDADLRDALNGLEASGHVIGKTVELAGRFWSLSVKGMFLAQSLN